MEREQRMDDTSRVSKRWLRQVAIVTMAGLSAGGMLALEHVGAGATTGQPSQVNPNAQTSEPTPQSKPTTSVPRHCGDGHGADGEKNKHCIPSGVI
jgi:hypothetical protein